ncbi:sirohydrochlorin cobaltochelatase [uncultured Cetobacterium sp.]|uniref:sirohydrochlorin cobaltochelatase n=1 Tax=uncultured Cetobacterium sp. TaxID=527638 RepID=UPI0026101DC7|nr:sirohydrochlorin cobaltochelatase [uncultured Cetobacterium sp.]
MNFNKLKEKKAILIAHFGTTHEDTKLKTIDEINKKIKEKYEEIDLFQVYTSRIINRILLKRGIENLNTSQMLKKLKEDGYKNILIQPTYIINGTEMEALKREVEIHLSSFNEIRVGNPLLSTPENYKMVVEALSQEIGDLSDDEGVVFVGHGTEHSATSAYPMLDYVAKALGKKFYIGTVEGYPTIENVIDLLKKDRINKVKLMPLMFVAGDHAKNDIAEDWKEELEANGFEINLDLRGLGEISKIQDIYLKNIKSIFEFAPEDILKKKKDYEKGKESNH